MRLALCLLAAGTALLTTSTAHAVSGLPGIVSLDGLPPDIVFTEGVAEEITVILRKRRRPNGLTATLCHGESWAQITIPEVIEAVAPCYADASDHTAPPLPGIGLYCRPGIGKDGLLYELTGDDHPQEEETFELTLSYDGSAPPERHGEWILWSDGRCVDQSDPIMRKAGSVNIHILPPGETHDNGYVATSTDPTGVFFMLDHPQLNGDPNARFIITPAFQDETPTSSNHGVFYYWSAERWAVYREDLSPMPADRDFVVAFGGERSLLHTTDSTNTEAFVTYLDDERINHNPYAAVFVTHNWNPPGGGVAIHDHAVGVYYSPWSGQWMIYNEDQETMPLGVGFNIVVASDWTGGWEEQVGQWPNDAPYMDDDAPAVLQHNYDFPESTYRTEPASFLTEVGGCLPPPYSYYCWNTSGAASPSGMYTDDTEFFVWSPFP